MFERILVPLDGSRFSEHALPFAYSLAKAAHARVLFVRAILTAGMAPGALSFNQELRHTAREYLDDHVERARLAGVAAEGHIWEDEAGFAILAMADATRPDLIVMSTHGRSGLGRVVWGSVADFLLHHSPVPMLLVPKGAEAAWITGRARFVVPLDGSALAEEALGPAEAMAAAFGGEIALVEAVEPSVWMIDAADPWASYSFDQSIYEMEAERSRAASRYLDDLAASLNSRGVTTSVMVAPGRATDVIRTAVRESQAQAIVMATHGRGGASRLLLGSVADSIVRSAHVPVLLVRPTAARVEPEREAWTQAEAERNVVVTLSQSDLDLTRSGLRHLVNGGGGTDAAPALALLNRLNQIEAAHQPATTPR
jgi:nucleotide-binding universal stress UspA family protein